ncbi:MAG TPA: hypothetical protein DEP72_01440 [Clostridiales bacterium]|nr:MAG: hypothetical protein A2Y18_05175 [Clostridiales bacterium GWD2_32_19]HCC06817.1 hypothetical protein [Clostridiales bacterium]
MNGTFTFVVIMIMGVNSLIGEIKLVRPMVYGDDKVALLVFSEQQHSLKMRIYNFDTIVFGKDFSNQGGLNETEYSFGIVKDIKTGINAIKICGGRSGEGYDYCYDNVYEFTGRQLRMIAYKQETNECLYNDTIKTEYEIDGQSATSNQYVDFMKNQKETLLISKVLGSIEYVGEGSGYK